MKVSNSKNGYIKSIELLTPNRIDIVFKYLYIKFYDKSKDFADEIYNEHIKIITNGLYKEIDNGKEGIDEFYINHLIKTSKNIKEKRFDPEISVIPVASDLSISNGAHRVASSIYLNKIYSMKHLIQKVIMDINSLKIEVYHQNILELAVLNYIELKSNTFLSTSLAIC